jgi:hypothetical protein
MRSGKRIFSVTDGVEKDFVDSRLRHVTRLSEIPFSRNFNETTGQPSMIGWMVYSLARLVALSSAVVASVS